MYQMTLKRFGNFDRIKLSTPLAISDLIVLALSIPEVGWTPEDGDPALIAQVLNLYLSPRSTLIIIIIIIVFIIKDDRYTNSFYSNDFDLLSILTFYIYD
jgi:hypothetical protein